MPAPDANPLSAADLVAFVVAVDARSVHGAADALGLTASAVSKRLQSLERRLGLALFERSRHGLRPTEAGRTLYPEARHGLDALQRAEASVSRHRDRAVATVSLASSHTIGEFLLPAWLAAFRLQEPTELRIQVDIVNSVGVIDAIRHAHAAIGFVEGLDPATGLDVVTVRRDELVVVVAPGHRWARRRSLAPEELAREPYFAREAGSGTRGVADAALGAAGVALDPALEAASTLSLKRALGARGFALLSRLAVEAEQAAGSLRVLPLRGVDLSRALRAIRDPRSRLPAPTARLWTWLREQAVG